MSNLTIKLKQLLSHQYGGILSMDDMKDIGRPIMQKDQLKLSPPSLTNKIAPKDPYGNTYIPASNQGTVHLPYKPSIRESAINILNKVDRNGDNGVAGIVTQPLKAGLNLLRPDKYFDNVHNDSDIGSAIGHIALDAATVAPIAGEASKLFSSVHGLAPALEGQKTISALGDIPKPSVSYRSEVARDLSEKDMIAANRYNHDQYDAYHDLDMNEPSIFESLYKSIFDGEDIKHYKTLSTKLQDLGTGYGELHIDPSNLATFSDPSTFSANPFEDILGIRREQFRNKMQQTHEIDDKTLDTFFNQHPDMDSKNLGFIAKRVFNEKLKPGFEHGSPTRSDTFNNVIDGQFIHKNNISTEYTPQEKLITSEYTRGYDKLLNGRSYDDLSNPALQHSVNAARDELENLIKKNKLQEPTTVHRSIGQYRIPQVYNDAGTIRNDVLANDLKVGDIYHPESFTSTTLNPMAAKGFGDIHMDIDLPGGGKQSILYPNAQGRSEFPHEHEVLLPRNLKYRVNAIDASDTGRPIYKMSVINPYSVSGLLGLTSLYGLKK